MKRFLRGLALFLAGLLVGAFFMTVLTASAADRPIRLFVDGVEIVFPEAPPQMINGRTMVPARPLAEALGAKVEWDHDNQSVIVTSKAAPGPAPAGGTIADRLLNLSRLQSDYGIRVTTRTVGRVTAYTLEAHGKRLHFAVEPGVFGQITGVSDEGVEVEILFTSGGPAVSLNGLRAAGLIR